MRLHHKYESADSYLWCIDDKPFRFIIDAQLRCAQTSPWGRLVSIQLSVESMCNEVAPRGAPGGATSGIDVTSLHRCATKLRPDVPQGTSGIDSTFSWIDLARAARICGSGIQSNKFLTCWVGFFLCLVFCFTKNKRWFSGTLSTRPSAYVNSGANERNSGRATFGCVTKWPRSFGSGPFRRPPAPRGAVGFKAYETISILGMKRIHALHLPIFSVYAHKLWILHNLWISLLSMKLWIFQIHNFRVISLFVLFAEGDKLESNEAAQRPWSYHDLFARSAATEGCDEHKVFVRTDGTKF